VDFDNVVVVVAVVVAVVVVAAFGAAVVAVVAVVVVVVFVIVADGFVFEIGADEVQLAFTGVWQGVTMGTFNYK
jgi:hypothetical protein